MLSNSLLRLALRRASGSKSPAVPSTANLAANHQSHASSSASAAVADQPSLMLNSSASAFQTSLWMTQRQSAIIAAFVATAREREVEDEAKRMGIADTEHSKRLRKRLTNKIHRLLPKPSVEPVERDHGRAHWEANPHKTATRALKRRGASMASTLSTKGTCVASRKKLLPIHHRFSNFSSSSLMSGPRKPSVNHSPFTDSEVLSSSVVLSRHHQRRTQSLDALPPAEHDRMQRMLYRQCRKVVESWGHGQRQYVVAMEGCDMFVRPSLRAAMPQLTHTMAPKALLRFIFEFRLPTDTLKMRLWCTQAAFTFLRRAKMGDVDRRLLAGWASITSPSFTAVDAAVLVAYIHRYFHPIHNPLHLVPLGMSEDIMSANPMLALWNTAGTNSGSGVSSNPNASAKGTKRAKGRPATPPAAAVAAASGGAPADPALAALLQKHELIARRRKQRTDYAANPAAQLPSLDAFSEPILIKLESLIERCRSSIPMKERLKPERHARLIVQSVLDVMRWEASLVAFQGVCGGKSVASLNAIDEALLRRQCSHRLAAVIVAHVLMSLGVRAVALCHDDLPLVAVYSRHRRNKLQCCVDVVNIAILGPEETKEALSGLGINMSASAIGARLLHTSESVVSQAASFLSAMKRDASLSDAEYAVYDKAAKFITHTVEADMVRRATGARPPEEDGEL